MYAPEAEYQGLHKSLLCPNYLEVLCAPVSLACNQLVCDCCIRHVALTSSLKCPCCYTDNITPLTISAPPTVVVNLLSSLYITCKTCSKPVQAGHYKEHIQANCNIHTADSPSRHSLREVLDSTVKTPTTRLERKAAGNIIRRIINEDSDSPVVKIPTHGQVATCIRK